MIASARAEVDAAARNAARDPAALERARLRFARLADRVRAETSALTWGRADAERERDAFVRRYGCVGWTDGALDVIAEHAPIVEIGAGRGLWQRELQRRGVDVLAYDDQSAIPGDADENYLASSSSSPPPSSPRGRVRVGNESALRSWRVRRENRTLLLVYPEGDLLPRCLRAYGGEVVLFVVGEGAGRGERGRARVRRARARVGGEANRRRQTLRGRPREALGAREEEEATGDELWSSLTEEEMCSSL